MSAPTTASGSTDASSPATAASTTDANGASSDTATDTSHVDYNADQLDKPGQVDGQRGRAAYSSVEKATEQFIDQLDRRRYSYDLQRQLDAENLRTREENRAEERRRRDRMFAEDMRERASQHLISDDALIGVQNADQVNYDALAAAIVEAFAKIAGLTPPVTATSDTPNTPQK